MPKKLMTLAITSLSWTSHSVLINVWCTAQKKHRQEFRYRSGMDFSLAFKIRQPVQTSAHVLLLNYDEKGKLSFCSINFFKCINSHNAAVDEINAVWVSKKKRIKQGWNSFGNTSGDAEGRKEQNHEGHTPWHREIKREEVVFFSVLFSFLDIASSLFPVFLCTICHVVGAHSCHLLIQFSGGKKWERSISCCGSPWQCICNRIIMQKWDSLEARIQIAILI